ncbi:hypothetical protein [Streptomyces sp. b84]|nr:hypothetical protein [Streptomyces sp. b84]
MTTEINPAVAAAVVVQDGRALLVRRRVSEGDQPASGGALRRIAR